MTALTAIALKWVVIGRTKPGRYPLWGVYYFRWWFVKRLEPLVHIKWLQGSPMIRRYLRLMGAQVGGDVIIADIDAGAIDLVSIGRGTTIGSKAKIANVEIIGNEMVIGEVHIGADVYIGSSCTIGHDVTIGHHAELADLTAIPEGTVIGEAEKWDGSPGVKVGMVDVAALPDFAEATPARRAAFDLCYAIALAAIPPVSLLPIFPAFYIFDQLDEQISEFLEVSYLWYLPVLAWPTALFMIFATVGLIALTRWLVLPQGPQRHLFDVQRLLHAQMGGGAGDRGDARDADLALRHDLHAGLVPRHGREDRQGRRDLDEPRRAATT